MRDGSQLKAELESQLIKASAFRGGFFEAERRQEVKSLLRKLEALEAAKVSRSEG